MALTITSSPTEYRYGAEDAAALLFTASGNTGTVIWSTDSGELVDAGELMVILNPVNRTEMVTITAEDSLTTVTREIQIWATLPVQPKWAVEADLSPPTASWPMAYEKRSFDEYWMMLQFYNWHGPADVEVSPGEDDTITIRVIRGKPFYINDIPTGQIVKVFFDSAFRAKFEAADWADFAFQLKSYEYSIPLEPVVGPFTPSHTEITSGLILRDSFASLDAWTSEGSWSIDTDVPALVASAGSDPSVAFSGTPGGADAMGVREGIIYSEAGTWYLLYDSGNAVPASSGYVWRMFMATSTDRGKTWTKEGQLSILFAKSNTPADGNWASRACGFIEKRGTTYYLHTIYAPALTGGEIPAIPYFSDIWSGPTPRGPWTIANAQVVTAGAPGAFDEAYAYGTCVVYNAGTYYLFYGGADGSADNNVGLATSSSPTGPWTKVSGATGLIPAPAGQPENIKVFWHPVLNRWVMSVNQISDVVTATTYNSIFVSTSLTDWSACKRYDTQYKDPIDSLGNLIIGVPSPLWQAEGVPVMETNGNLGITFDGDTTDLTTSHHHGRRIKYATLQAAPTALRYNALDATFRLLHRPLVHSDFVAEFEVDASQFGTNAALCFDFRLDSATGNTGYRLIVRFDNSLDRKLLLQTRTAGVWATTVTGTGTITSATNSTFTSMARIRVVASGSTIKAWLSGELQINTTAAAYLSGNAIAFAGLNVESHVRLFKMYRTESLIITNIGSGDVITLRGASDVPIKQQIADGPIVAMTHPSFPLQSIQVNSKTLSLEATNWALASNGAMATASSEYNANTVASYANDGSRVGANSNTNYWTSATAAQPHTLEIDLGAVRQIEVINVFTAQSDPFNWLTPTLTMTFTQYGARAYSVEYWTGSAWAVVPGGSISGNDKVWRQFVIPVTSTSKIRVIITDSSDDFGRITEIEAWSPDGIWGGSFIKS
jgi:hypothetical protein